MTCGTPRIVTGVARSADPAVMESVKDSGIAVAVWDRGADTAIPRWLGELAERGLPSFRRVIQPDEAGQTMADYLSDVVPTAPACHDALVGLVRRSAEALTRITPCPRIRLRIDVPRFV